jgi:glycine cleavage system H protein
VAVNADLSRDPGLVSRDPYGAGWLVRLRVEGAVESGHLMDARAYEAQVSETPH